MNITINTYGGELTEQETDLILSKAKEIKGCDHVTVNIDGDWLDVKYNIMSFVRLARITGYLTTTVDRWNDAKRAELKDRVKHDTL
jgi:hypothetical protein